MTKASNLSSDIDIIKEFEELKLKQKLLIESLKRNSDSSTNKLFLEINSKLDFLVKIFTESSNSVTEEVKIDYEAKFNDVLDKISALSQNVDEKFSKLSETIDDIKNSQISSISKISIPSLEVPKFNNVSSIKVESNLELPPPPNFETKLDLIQNSTEDEKKKKWF